MAKIPPELTIAFNVSGWVATCQPKPRLTNCAVGGTPGGNHEIRFGTGVEDVVNETVGENHMETNRFHVIRFVES